MVSPTESSRVCRHGPSPQLVSLLSSPGCGSSGRGMALDCSSEGEGDKALFPCVPNEPAGSGSQLWLSGVMQENRLGACRGPPGDEGLVEALEMWGLSMPGRSACQDRRGVE